jgi:hypothetical protein
LSPPSNWSTRGIVILFIQAVVEEHTRQLPKSLSFPQIENYTYE